MMAEMGTTPRQRERYFASHPEVFICNRDAFAKGVATEATPVPGTCEFCGAEILTWGFMGTQITGQDNGIIWRPEPERCGCRPSLDHWARVDKMTDLERSAVEHQLRQKAERDSMDRLLRQSRLIDAFGGKTFSEFVTGGLDPSIVSAKAKAEGFSRSFTKAEEFGKGLLFSGPSGTGKTHLAAAAALEICKQGKTVIALEAVELLSRIRSSYNRDSRESEDRLMAIFTNVDLLFVDDLGKEKPSEWTLEKLFWIFDVRCKRKKPVIVTINYSDQELVDRLAGKNKYGEYELDIRAATAIVSRLHEMTWKIAMVGKDYRGRL